MNALTARNIAAFAVGASVLLATVCASAQTVERDIVGWTTTGSEVVVHLTKRGERMVDGVATDYYFEATEIWSASDGSLVQRYKRGEAVGSPPKSYATAKEEKLATSYLDNVGVREAVDSASSPDGNFRLEWFGTDRVESPSEGEFQCESRHRLVLLSRTERRAYTVLDMRERGEVSRRRDEAACPTRTLSPAWSPGSDRWAALLVGGDEPKVLVGGVSDLNSYAYADFFVPPPSILSFVPEAEKAGWAALERGDLDAAVAAFEGMPLHQALVKAWSADRSKTATRNADKAYRKTEKAPRDTILRAAAWVVAGSTKKATGWIDEAVKSASSYQDLLGFAAVFELVDVDIANQLFVHALSHPSAEGQDLDAAWIALAAGLVETGNYSKAEEALEHFEEPPRAALVEQAHLHLDRRDARKAKLVIDDLLFSNPGRCENYLLAARWQALQGANTVARDLFDTAVFCDENLHEALFYAADFARLAGDMQRAKELFEKYASIAIPRRSDEIRDLRRDAAQRWARRLGHDGVIVTDASCRPAGGAWICSGTLRNTTSEPVTNVKVEVRGKRQLGSSTIESIEPATSVPFGVRVETKSLADVVISAGRDSKERKLNETPAR